MKRLSHCFVQQDSRGLQLCCDRCETRDFVRLPEFMPSVLEDMRKFLVSHGGCAPAPKEGQGA